MSQKLTPKQKIFIEEFPVDLNATQAALRSGYSPRSAKEIGYENLTKPHIVEEIIKTLKERCERTQIDADYVLTQAVKLHERCMQEVRPLTDSQGNHKQDEHGNYLFVFNASAAARALEIIGKHTSIHCFKERQRPPEDDLPVVILHDPSREYDRRCSNCGALVYQDELANCVRSDEI